ncbi:HISTONE DEACETYLASE HDA1, putative [Babesia bigemina]|uniref:histone deacetylase n=1 Tax=Babesia bigemina TaxID=5866 RepID=A0A061D6H5_BABBI|nr:HISTONE DEACETYLASE HDA1, putative [Babesia bigemina]CDR96281.1 HISTONE DEACETYLASE HDA1, putative [Babesia bigemina]|eukprot:XP_012768467.1 HISTONE DEACETYLASE HDA1, putative [Babesia bigemina]
MDPPELVAICCDEKTMCSRRHCDTSGRGHPEDPTRLKAIIDLLRHGRINLESYGERFLADFTRTYACRPATLEMLLYCHTESHVRRLMGFCHDVEELNAGCAADDVCCHSDSDYCTSYPVDEDTYVTKESERVARLAVGGMTHLADVIMGKADMYSDMQPEDAFDTAADQQRDRTRVKRESEPDIDSNDLSSQLKAAEGAENLLNSGDTAKAASQQHDLRKDRNVAVEHGTTVGAGMERSDSSGKSPAEELNNSEFIGDVAVQLSALSVSDAQANVPRRSGVRKGFSLTRPPGHHATRDKMMGFCLYNNVAITAVHLLRNHGLKRIAIVDIDVHHGNGTQEIFYDNANVCVISIHRYGTHNNAFYPYSGNYDEIGGKGALGSNVNIPLTAGYGTHDMVYAFQEVVLPKLERFKPEFILVSCGFDAAIHDFLGGCGVTPECYGWMALELSKVAERHSKGRLLLAFEGGYNPAINASCSDAIFRTLIEYETDRRVKRGCGYNRSKVRRGTRFVCSKLRGLLFSGGDSVVDTSSSLSRSRTHSPLAPSVTPSARTAQVARPPDLKWTEYHGPMTKNSFVIAGGHPNQFLIPVNVPSGDLCKICSPNEVAFYRWLYRINGIDLEVISRPYPYLRLPFANGVVDVSITGFRPVTDSAASPTTKRLNRANVVHSPDPVVTEGLNLLKPLIRFVVQCTGVYTESVFAAWPLQYSHRAAVRLRNAIHGMRTPCVMDIKMGTRLYGDNVTDSKRIAEKQSKAEKRSCSVHGFHISGMFHWCREAKKLFYLQGNVANTLETRAKLLYAFRLYFARFQDTLLSVRICEKFLQRLEELRMLFEKQNQLAFYGSSLLFVYDSGTVSTGAATELANVHMIDLSHVSYNTGCIDEGYLLGLRTLIELLRETRKSLAV